MFKGSELRLARIFNNLTLEELAEKVGKTKQYIQKLETNNDKPTETLEESLADALYVLPSFFYSNFENQVYDEICHFRKARATKISTKQSVIARGEFFQRLKNYFEQHLSLPKVNFPYKEFLPNTDIELEAELFRKSLDLGNAPIDNMCLLAENSGVIIAEFNMDSKDVDALSVDVTRPFIIRNDAKKSICRFRFDNAHEMGHLILHQGIMTGDRVTEKQANHFASALLLPRAMMFNHFPRPKGVRLNWKEISEFKLWTKVSKAAILYRANQLELISPTQYKSAWMRLNRSGEAIVENEDHLIPQESPELLKTMFKVLADKKHIYAEDIAKELHIRVNFLENLIGFKVEKRPKLYVVN